jgi:hypothetical protein
MHINHFHSSISLMNNSFELKKGKLVFEDDKIIITDDVKYRKRMRLISAILLFCLGVFNFINYFKTNDVAILFNGIIFGIGAILLIIAALLVNVQSEINLSEVTSMRIKRILFREYLVIKVANKGIRQVAGIYNAERLKEYINTISLPK